MDGSAILAVVITGIFGLFIAWQNYLLSQKVRTNHGKNIGEHLEEVGDDIKDAATRSEAARVEALASKTAAQLVALELREYKAQQAADALAVKIALEDRDNNFERALIEHTADDARNFAELRSLLIQGLAIKGAA